jgi:histidine triad (HIT) family protein
LKDCLFCKIIKREIPSKIVYEDNEIIAIEDIDPKAPIHILIMPKRHISTILDINEEDKELIGTIFIKASSIAKDKGISRNGFRIVVNCGKHGGQAVYHLHFHLLGGRLMGWPPG